MLVMSDGEYEQIAKKLIEQTRGFPRQHLEYAIRVRAAEMAKQADVDQLWRWARASAWHVENELNEHGWAQETLVGLFQRALQKYHQDEIWNAVRYME
jgi:hypothetical protein